MNRLGLIVGALALGTAWPAAAEPLLWGKVVADMPFEQARAAYPDAQVLSGKSLSPPGLYIAEYDIDGCKASVDIFMDRKVAEPGAKVKNVQLRGMKCDSKMFAQLIAKYGPPQAVNDDNRLQKEKKAVWVAEGKTVTFDVQYGSPDMWTLTYAPVKDLGL